MFNPFKSILYNKTVTFWSKGGKHSEPALPLGLPGDPEIVRTKTRYNAANKT